MNGGDLLSTDVYKDFSIIKKLFTVKILGENLTKKIIPIIGSDTAIGRQQV